MNYFFTIVGLVLLADFISGVGHWFEDTYGNPNWRILGDLVIKPNLEHHQTPRSFISRSYWYRNNTSILACFVIVLSSWVLGFFSWQLLLYLPTCRKSMKFTPVRIDDPMKILQLLGFFKKSDFCKVIYIMVGITKHLTTAIFVF